MIVLGAEVDVTAGGGAAGGGGGGAIGAVMGLVWLAVAILFIAGSWKVFVKAGKPGWGVLIPIYNVFLFLDIAGRPAWWFLLLLIPVVSLIVCIVLAMDVARKFGKSGGFAIGLVILPFIFYPVLGFGSAQYEGGGGGGEAPPADEGPEEDAA
jgi:hypothetical protein